MLNLMALDVLTPGQPCSHANSLFSVCPKGFFLLLNGSGSKDGETASVSVPAESLSATLCVEFWYQMSGPSVPSLNLHANTVCILFKDILLHCELLYELFYAPLWFCFPSFRNPLNI